MKYLMLLTMLFSFSAYAESSSDDFLLFDEAVQAPIMDLEGQYQVKEEAVKTEPVIVKELKEVKAIQEVIIQKVDEPTKPIQKIAVAERVKTYRELLEERNRLMVERKLEQIRLKQEVALTNHLEQSMNQTLKAIETIK